MGMVGKSTNKPCRFEIYLVNLNPTIGSEIQKTRPCLIISPDEMNHTLSTVIVAPLTTKQKNYPMRIALTFDGKNGFIALDQIRTLDQSRLIKKLGQIGKILQRKTIALLQEMFCE